MAFRRIQCQPCVPPIFLGTNSAITHLARLREVLPTGLMASYSFDEGTGTIAADGSGNGNTGAIQEASWDASGRHARSGSFFRRRLQPRQRRQPGIAADSESMEMSRFAGPVATVVRSRRRRLHGGTGIRLSTIAEPGSSSPRG